MSTYIQDALRTKSPLFIFDDPSVQSDLRDAAARAVYSGQIAGAIKKCIFYGKDPEIISKIELDGPGAALTAKRESGIDVKGLDPDVVHGILGVYTEACELMELLLDSLVTGQPIDHLKLVGEVGDGFWYNAILCNGIGVTFEAVQAGNIAKLKARFPDKFTQERAEHRDVSAENTALARAS